MKVNYVVLDAAKMGDKIYEAKAFNVKHESLFKGSKEEILPEVAPYLFTFRSGSIFANWLQEEGQSKSWGIFISSKHNFKELHRHLRRFLRVKTEEGKKLYFRFYDPRVLRLILPTYDEEQLDHFFDKVDGFMVEDEDMGAYLKFRRIKDKLKSERISIEK